mgnify:FL=1
MNDQPRLPLRSDGTAADACRPPPALVSPRPFLRWAGGKTRLLQALNPHFPTTFNNYFEPFLGSGAVFFHLRDRAFGRYFLSDLNDEIANIWRVVQSHPGRLLREVDKYQGLDTEDEYYAVRERATPRSNIKRAARFLYLNQTAWNSLWRVNKQGVFNVPWGARPFRGIDADSLRAVTRVIHDASIENIDFRQALAKPRAGDFVYLDPPYLPVSDTSKFSGYTGKRFRLADLEDLADICKDMTQRGVTWTMSNRNTPVVRELFGTAKMTHFTTRRSVAAQNRRNVEPADSPEIIVTNRAPC